MHKPRYLDVQNLIVLVGRTNVGKSCLFNRIVGLHQALVADEKHLTRDINIGCAFWRARPLNIVDTGGADIEQRNNIDDLVWEKVNESLKFASVIVFVTDVRQGISPFERQWIKDLQKLQKPIIIAGNKADSANLAASASEFYKLGVKTVVPISALTGSGIGDLLDEITNILPEDTKPKIDHQVLRVSIVGKTNVGKSSLVNKLLGENRMIVSEIPHTTREPIDSCIKWGDNYVVLVDTAGLRRRSKMSNETEHIGATRTWHAIQKSDIIFFMLDAADTVSAQDKRIAGMVYKSKKPMIIIANKWDLIPDKTTETMEKFRKFFFNHFPYLKGASIIFTSAKSGSKTKDVFEKAFAILKESRKILDEEELTLYLRKKLPPQDKVPVKFKSAKQISNMPVTFEIHLKTKKKLAAAFYTFLENRIRERFGFDGCPMEINVINLNDKKHHISKERPEV